MESALAAVDSLAREQLARWGVPGLAVGVVADGRTAARAWGVASLDTREPVTPETTFRVASVTKPFTAALARAVLDLDEPLETPAGPVSSRLLLAHMGGLRCEAAEPLDGFATVSDAVAGSGLRAWGEPGRLWVYSNAGYWLVGAAVERATGLRFEEAMRAHVLAPRGLGAATGFGSPSAAGHEPVEPEAVEHRPYPVTDYPAPRRPSGGLVSSVGDLLRFAETWWDDEEARAVVARRPGGLQGAGWMLDRRDGIELLLHPGSAAGFQSVLVLVPERRVAVAALANSARGQAAFTGVVDALLEHAAGVPPGAPAIVDLPAGELEPFAGRYAGLDEEAGVGVVAGGLSVQLSQRDPFTHEVTTFPPFVGRPIGDGAFAVVEGEASGSHFDFPEAFFRLGSVLAERVP
ncbi:MAG: serine hydrolase domain-containing protein [Pseudomonadota bacterium]